MNPRTYSLIAAGILTLLGAIVIGSLIQNIDFFHRELAIAFPEKTTTQQEGIDRITVARIARAINLRGSTEGGGEGVAVPNEVAPALEQQPSMGPQEPGTQATISVTTATTSTTTKAKNSPR